MIEIKFFRCFLAPLIYHLIEIILWLGPGYPINYGFCILKILQRGMKYTMILIILVHISFIFTLKACFTSNMISLIPAC